MNSFIIDYNKEHLISLHRIIAEYEVYAEKPFSKTHLLLIENINQSIKSAFYTKNFMVSKSELGYLYSILQFRITQINKEIILQNTPGIQDEIKWLIKPLESFNKKRIKVLYMLLEQQ